jgi:hypothetical protein
MVVQTWLRKRKKKKEKKKKEKSRIEFALYRAVQYVRRCKYVDEHKTKSKNKEAGTIYRAVCKYVDKQKNEEQEQRSGNDR